MALKEEKTELNTLTETFLEKDVLDAGSKILKETNSDSIKACAKIIAKAFGTDDSFSFSNAEAESKLVTSFNSNLTLLIQKTWVESYDAGLKEQVLYQLEQFSSLAKNGEWDKIYTPFIKIIYDAVYLMFGSQAKKDDFLEYAFRVDPEFGTFWWYLHMLPQETDWPAEKCRVLVLLGMYFLANY
ncbi:MAG: hypothetical protein K5640_05750 [Treponema sp.]|nr:hypothetical protein [Treponema sp.]